MRCGEGSIFGGTTARGERALSSSSGVFGLRRGTASIGAAAGDSGSCSGCVSRRWGGAGSGAAGSAGVSSTRGRGVGALAARSRPGRSAEPGELMSVPGASLKADPGSGVRRRSVTSSAPSRSSPWRAPPRLVSPNRTITSTWTSMESTTNWMSVGSSILTDATPRRAGLRWTVTCEAAEDDKRMRGR